MNSLGVKGLIYLFLCQTVANEADDNGKEPSCPSLEQWPSDLPKTKTIAPVPSAANQPGVQGCTPVPSLQPGSPQSNPPDNPGSGVVLSQPGNWSHGARWHRSSAVLLRYHKYGGLCGCHWDVVEWLGGPS